MKELEEIKTWKENEVNAIYDQYKIYKEKLDELRKIWKTNGGSDNFNQLKYFKYSNTYFYSLTYHGDQSEEFIKKVIQISVDQHFIKLQNKVEKEIGTILTIQSSGNYYKFTGEKGSCDIDVILAGGYNIQKLHTRWLIKKHK